MELADGPETAFFTYAAGMASCAAEVRVGAAAAELQADDSMVLASGIHPRRAKGQEGQLRAVAETAPECRPDLGTFKFIRHRAGYPRSERSCVVIEVSKRRGFLNPRFERGGADELDDSGFRVVPCSPSHSEAETAFDESRRIIFRNVPYGMIEFGGEGMRVRGEPAFDISLRNAEQAEVFTILRYFLPLAPFDVTPGIHIGIGQH